VQEFIVILIIAFVLFGVFRRMMFGSFYAAMKKHQDELDRKEDEERRRKREGKVFIEETRKGKPSRHDEGEYVDYEELN
jgi:hypothetical protein